MRPFDLAGAPVPADGSARCVDDGDDVEIAPADQQVPLGEQQGPIALDVTRDAPDRVRVKDVDLGVEWRSWLSSRKLHQLGSAQQELRRRDLGADRAVGCDLDEVIVTNRLEYRQLRYLADTTVDRPERTVRGDIEVVMEGSFAFPDQL